MKTGVKKFFICVVKILIILFLVITLNRIFMPKYLFENKDGRITQEYYSAKGNADVIFVGSSTVYSGVSPLVLFNEQGITSYVRANASQPMWISYYMIEDALKYDKPELVCLDIGFIKYADDYVEEPSSRKSIDGMRFSKSKIGCIKASMGKDEKMMDYLVPLFRFHSRWKELTLDDFRYAYYNGMITYNGMLKDTTVKPAQSDELVYLKDGDTRFGDRNVMYLNKIIELCKKNDIQLFLFKVPSMSTNWCEDYDNQIQKIANENGLSYMNFDSLYKEMGIDYSMDTPDEGSHLNSYGAIKFTSYLGNYLKENYNISDHSNDEKLKYKWDEMNRRFDANVN